MDLNELINKFDKLTPQDAADLNDLQSEYVFEITEGGNNHSFTLQAYSADLLNLTSQEGDEYCERAGGDNPNRKVRKS